MIALAAAANGINIKIQCTTEDTNGRPKTVTLSDAKYGHSSCHSYLEVHLWLVQPLPLVADRLRSVVSREDFEPRTVFSGMLPIFGGAA